MTAIEIRPAVRDDAEALAEAHLQGWRVGYRVLLPDWYLDADSFAANMRRRWYDWAWNSSGNNALFTAVVERTAVGFGLIGPVRDADRSGSGEVFAMYLHPATWGSGAAGPLMAACVEWFAARGWSDAVLWVLRDNPRARRFYAKTGWQPTGRSEMFSPAVESDREPISVAEVEYRIVLPATA